MSVAQFNQVSYGLTQSLIDLFPPPIVSQRAPTGNDKAVIGTTWINSTTNFVYMITSITANVADWEILTGGGGGIAQFTTNAGIAIPAAGNINIVGGGATNITTSGAGSTITTAVIASPSFAGTTKSATGFIATTGNIVASTGNISATLGDIFTVTGNITSAGDMLAGTTITALGDIESSGGSVSAFTTVSAGTSVSAGTTVTAGTGITVSDFTAGVVQSSNAGVFSSTEGTDGQLLISSSVGAPAWATITPGANITVTNGNNKITIAANAGASTLNYTQTAVTPYVVAAADDFIAINSSGGAKQVNLPNAPATGRIFVIKDYTGSAAANNITVTTVGGVINIDGATTYILNVNYESIQVLFDGTNYEIY